MGWGSGTEVFDRVTGVVLAEVHNRGACKAIIEELYEVLTDLDWDNVCESEFKDNPTVKGVLKQKDPGIYED